MSGTPTAATIAIGDVAISADALDAGRARAILDARTRQLALPPAARPDGERILLFLLGGERLAVPLARVAEVAPAAAPTPLPGAPPALLGLIAQRGLVYNLIDPAPALGLASEAGRHMLLLRGPVPRLALRVTEALGTSRVAEDGGGSDGGGLTGTVLAADGARAGLIALDRLIEALGLRRTGRNHPGQSDLGE